MSGPTIEEISSSEEEVLLKQDDQGDRDQATESPVEEAAAEPEIQLTEEEIAERLSAAEELKNKGNAAYQEGRLEEAIQLYGESIAKAPPKHAILSILYANRAACHLALSQYDQAVADCDESLKIDENYVKALYRRAKAHHAKDNYRSALQDYEKIAELQGKETTGEVKSLITTLKPLAAKQEEEEKEKMMGELKKLGNQFLGLFGLSLDNFEAKQDATTGGYSINFKQ